MRVCVTGTPGAGKTTLAKRLANKYGWKYISGSNLRENCFEFARNYIKVDLNIFTDALIERLSSLHENCIVDARSAWKWADITFVLTCFPEEAARRKGVSPKDITDRAEFERGMWGFPEPDESGRTLFFKNYLYPEEIFNKATEFIDSF